MANNYTESSSFLSCDADVAAEVTSALVWLSDLFESETKFDTVDEYTKIVEEASDLTDRQRKFLGHVAICEIVRECLDEWGDLYLGFECEDRADGLWFYGEESIDVEKVADVAHAAMSAYSIEGYMQVSFSWGCSKQRIDEFGGDTFVVTKDEVHVSPKAFWFHNTIEAINSKKKFYFATIREVNGEMESDVNFLMKRDENLNDWEELVKVTSEFRGNAVPDEEDSETFWVDGIMIMQPHNIKEIDAHTYKVMSKYLSSL